MADGRIRIDTSLNNKGLAKDLNDVKTIVKKTTDSIKLALGKGLTLDGLKKQIKEQGTIINQGEKQITSYQKRLDNINAEKSVVTVQKAMDAQNASIEKAKAKLEEYQAKMNQLEAKRSVIEASALDTAKLGGDGTFGDNPKSLNKRKDDILSGDKNYQKIIDQEIEMAQKMESYQLKIGGAEASVSKLADELERTKSTQINTLNSKITETASAVDKAKSKLSKLTSAFVKLKEKMNLSSSAKKTSKALDGTSNSAKELGKNVTNSANKGIKSLAKVGLAVFSVRSAYTFARKAADEYLQTNEQLSGQVAGIWNTIAQAIGPVVEQIVSWIVTLVSYVNALVKAFTGVDLVAKANAKALDKQATSTGNLAKETEKANRQMAGFDEMEVLSNKSSDSSGSGAGGVDVPQLTLDPINIDGIKEKLLELFEPIKNAWDNYGQGFVDSFKYALTEVWELVKSIGRSFAEVWANGTGQKTVELLLQIFTDVFNIIGKLAEKFREAWDAGGLGTAIIQALWDALNNCLEVVKTILDFFLKLANQVNFSPLLKGILGILQGLKDVTGYAKKFTKDILDAIRSGDWASIGVIIGNAFNNAFGSLNSMITSIDWYSTGRTIGTFVYDGIITIWDTIINFFTTLDWSLIGETVTNALDGLLQMAIGFLDSVDWIELGIKIATAIFEGLSGIIELIFSIDWFKLLGDIGELCVKGLVYGLATLVTAIVSLFVKMVEGILEFLGIHSPSTLFMEMGENILKGIQNGLAGLVDFFVNLFKEAWKGIVEIFKDIGKWFEERYEDIKKALFDVAKWFEDKFNEAKQNVIGAFENIGIWFNDKWKEIKNFLSNIPGWFKEKFQEAYDGITGIFRNIGNFFGGLWDTIKEKFSALGTTIGDAIGGAVKSGINGVLSMIEGTINTGIRMINGAIGLINLIPGVKIDKLTLLDIPRLAKGGIVNNPGPGINMGSYIAGERGPEAVVPLTDSQFIKDFALEIAKYLNGNDQPVNIVLKIGDKEFYKWLINMKKKYDFVTNGG